MPAFSKGFSIFFFEDNFFVAYLGPRGQIEERFRGTHPHRNGCLFISGFSGVVFLTRPLVTSIKHVSQASVAASEV